MPLVQSPQNFGRLINLITGIQGVAPGGQASINMPVNQRIHRLNFQCTGIGWVAPTVTPPSAGNGDAVLTPTVVNGVITAVTITAAGTGYTNGVGLAAVIKDEVYGTNLFGANITMTIAGGSVTLVTVVSGGVVSPVPAERFFTSLKHLVNGTIMRDISAAETLSIARATNQVPFFNGTVGSFSVPQVPVDLLTVGVKSAVSPYKVGQLPTYFTDPARRIVNHDTATSWDLFGQSTYQILAGISPTITTPGLVGTYEFDFLRNAIRNQNPKAAAQYFLKPVKQHSFSFNVPAGMYDITTLPITFPIQRLWFYGPAAPYQLEIYQDGNKVLEGTVEQINQMARDYGFNTDAFAVAAIFDLDQRLGNALKCQRSLDVRVWNTNASQLSVVMESTPPAYA